jgi:hypothetical protein
VNEHYLSVLFTAYPDRHTPTDPVPPGWILDYSLTHIPWPRINAVWFLVDNAHANSFAAAREVDAATVLDDPETMRHVRAAQELGVAAPLRSGLILSENTFQDSVNLAQFATALLWITPFSPDSTASPTWLAAEVSQGNAILRWTPTRDAKFYTYEVFRMGPDGQPGPCLSPRPLRAALWVDTAPPPGTHIYGIRTVTASGVTSDLVSGPPIHI